MPLSSWSDQQIVAQLDSGSSWSGATITYTFATSTAGIYTGSGEGSGFKALSSAQQLGAQRALSLWDDLISPDMQKIAAGSSYGTANLEFGQSSTGVSYAHAYDPQVGSVWFNSTYGSTSGTNNLQTPTIGQHGFATYVHEIGHAIGLEHMGDYNGSASEPSCYQDSTVYSIMSYFGPSWGSGSDNGEGSVAWADWTGADGKLYSPQTPMLNDIMAIQSIYGVETTTRTGDTVYGFNSTVTGLEQAVFDFTQNLHPILTIFDSAGIDTLDLSGWSTASTINLGRGCFSSGNSMTMNVAIAYTCDIENAVGGAGADTVTGNGLANALRGGAGNDQIFGLGGADVINGGQGNDLIDGGDGIDYVQFDLDWSALSFAYDSISLSITFSGIATGIDTISNVEYFTDALNVTRSLAELTSTIVDTTEPPSPPEPPAPPAPPVTASLSPTAFSITEGSSTAIHDLVVSLSGPSDRALTLDWSLAFGSGSSSASASDFLGATSGTLSFEAGQTEATIDLAIAGDGVFERDETFSVVLANPSSGVTFGIASAIGKIINDDGAELIGTERINTLTGTSFDDAIYGRGGNDALYGGAGNDVLDGGLGIDVMVGGAGNDTYIVDSARDRVSEDFAGGFDEIRTSLASFVLSSNVENLVYTGTKSFTGTGNILDNRLQGGSGNDALDGGRGADTLSGGLGRDAFSFTAALGGGNVDRILDFNAADDTIRLENAVFTAFGRKTGTLAASAFTLGTAAQDASDRIIYNADTGSLLYDRDGTGAAAPVEFAVLVGVTGPVTYADFVIV